MSTKSVLQARLLAAKSKKDKKPARNVSKADSRRKENCRRGRKKSQGGKEDM
jgi:hypothetical protein